MRSQGGGLTLKLSTDDPWVLAYGADEGEVKGHVGSKGQVEYGHVHHFWV